MLFWRRCWAISSGSHRFRDLEKDKRKTRIFTCSLQLSPFYPVFPGGSWQFRHFLSPFPPLFCWGHLSTFLQYLQGAEAAAQTPCVCPGSWIRAEEGESSQGCAGVGLPQLQSTAGWHRTALLVPCTMAGSQSLPHSCHLCFHHTLFVPVADPVSRYAHWHSLPGLKAQTSETIYICTPSQRLLTSSLCSPLLWVLLHISTEKK